MQSDNLHVIQFDDIRDTFGGSWICSAKNINYTTKYNVLCADLRIGLQYFHSGHRCEYVDKKRVCGNINNKHAYVRDCIRITNETMRLANRNGKFIKDNEQKIYENRITIVTGLDQSRVEYFPGNTLCYSYDTLTTAEYCCTWNRVQKEICIDYTNYTYVIFHNSQLCTLTKDQYVNHMVNVLRNG